MIKIKVALRGQESYAYVDVLGAISISAEEDGRTCYLQTQAGSFTVLSPPEVLMAQVREKREQVS